MKGNLIMFLLELMELIQLFTYLYLQERWKKEDISWQLL